MNKTGQFIVMEGVEGSGKTTQIRTVEAVLREAGHSIVTTREPGGTALGEQLRALLLDPDLPDLCGDAELLLMFAARAQHLHEVIRPALARGQSVISDRFTDASFAYQGAGRKLGKDRVAMLEGMVLGEVRPDCVLLFDLPPEIGLERAVQRGRRDRIEREDLEFFRRVREAYRERAQAHPERYRMIDASASIGEVARQVRAVLENWV